MTTLVDVERLLGLDDYAAVGHLAHMVADLRAEAGRLVPRLQGRTVWMVNSTASGGGVAEMLPTLVTLLRELGVATRWVVIESDRPEFFALTKRIHNMIHGVPQPPLGAGDAALYDAVSRANADALLAQLSPKDVLVVHDPQPLGAGALVAQELGVPAIWRCHIGLDEDLPAAREAWAFLEPHTAAYDRSIFSSAAYVPDFLAERSIVSYPALDPLDHKNRDLSLHKLVGILCDGALAVSHWPLLSPPFPQLAQRLQTDGTFAPATVPEDIGLLGRPIVTQVSRWDRLKGFMPLLDAFRELKLAARRRRTAPDERHRRRLESARLVLAGPDAASIADDPEALEVVDELCARYVSLEPEIQRDVALLSLPMASRKHNALMVNALQRASTIVAQNSLREGFGLTITEAMWKGVPVLASARARGPREQIRDGADGRLVDDPEDVPALAEALDRMLADARVLEQYGRTAQRRVRDEFLIFTQLRRWLGVLVEVAGRPARGRG
jgi:trehalose synthase